MRPSSFSFTLIPNFFNSLARTAILSVSLYRACLTLKSSMGFEVLRERIAKGGRRSGVSCRSNFPPSSLSSDLTEVEDSQVD